METKNPMEWGYRRETNTCVHYASPVVIAQDEDDINYIGLKINIKNTVYMASKDKGIRYLEVNKNVKIGETDEFKYLRLVLSKQVTTRKEIKITLGD